MDEGAINLAQKLASFDEAFQPKIVGSYNDDKIQIAKVRGEFVWHSHPDTDDFFLVLKGRLTIQLPDRDVELSEGELFVVPRGVEPRGTPNVGDADVRAAPEVEI